MSRSIAAILFAASCGCTALSSASSADSDGFVRSIARDGLSGFETATRVYRAADGIGPEVALVGVVHIGDRGYYDGLVAILQRYELVLFESVLPRGAFGTGGSTDLERQHRTQDAMLFARGLIGQFAQANGRVPADIAELRAFVVGRDTRLARPLDLALIDGWRGSVSYERLGDLDFRLRSLGADGATGGRGPALDLELRELPQKVVEEAINPKPSEEGRRDLYGDLAAALDTQLQVRSINYDRGEWIPADLPLEELLDRLWRRGERSATIEMLSEPGGFQQGVLRFLLSMVSKSPSFKRMVIQALGSAGERAGSTRGGSAGLGSVDQRLILDERNDAVVEQLRAVLASASPPRSVAIFYGAAHMPDFGNTLEREFGLQPGEPTWSRAMSVDEWSVQRISARIQKLRDDRDAVIAADPAGAYPACERFDERIGELEERLAARDAVTPAE